MLSDPEDSKQKATVVEGVEASQPALGCSQILEALRKRVEKSLD